MNEAELSAILYYADLLSMKSTSHPITNNCKYFFVHKTPMHISFIVNQLPQFDKENQYFQQSLNEYRMLTDKYGNDGAMSFINNLCNLGVAGSVNGLQMLKYIHRYTDKYNKYKAFKEYGQYIKNQKYTFQSINDDGELETRPCTKYIANDQISRLTKGSRLYGSL